MTATFDTVIRYLLSHGVRSRAAVIAYFAPEDRAIAGEEYDRITTEAP